MPPKSPNKRFKQSSQKGALTKLFQQQHKKNEDFWKPHIPKDEHPTEKLESHDRCRNRSRLKLKRKSLEISTNVGNGGDIKLAKISENHIEQRPIESTERDQSAENDQHKTKQNAASVASTSTSEQAHVISIDIDEDGSCGSVIKKEDKITKLKTQTDSDNQQKQKQQGEKQKQDEEEQQQDEQMEAKEEQEYLVPYYLENFRIIIQTILDDPYYNYLFNEQDTQSVAILESLSEPGCKLFIRLFQRQHRWIRRDRISYPKIAEDLTDIFDELVTSGLIMNEHQLTNLPDILAVLSAPDVKTLAKSLRINVQSQQKEALVQSIIKHSQQAGIQSFFKKKNNASNDSMVKKRALSMLGSCYKVQDDHRDVFLRMLVLFTLHNLTGYEDSTPNALMFQMLMSNIGKSVYPSYQVLKSTRIFEDRDDFLRTKQAVVMESEMMDAMETKDFEAAEQLYHEAVGMWTDLITDESQHSYSSALPAHLRRYTYGSFLTRILTYGVDLLEKLRQYEDAVALLRQLLEQKIYLTDYRGRWYDRLALNLHTHLKRPEESLSTIEMALREPYPQTGHRYALYLRGHKICNMPKFKKDEQMGAFLEHDPMKDVKDPVKITIQARKLQHEMGNTGTIFILGNSTEEALNDDVVVMKRVEDVVIAHFKEQGYTHGIHGESSTFKSLLGLLMWDELYYCEGIPDVFLNPYQVAPLDLQTEDYYTRRKAVIDRRLDAIRDATPEELQDMIGEVWEKHENTMSAFVNWEIFSDAEECKGLAVSLGATILAGIFEIQVKNLRHTRSGMPDLVVWNPDNRIAKIVEVKGPNDRLSNKQIVWLDRLTNLGADACVCYVEAIGAKRLSAN